MRLGVCMIFLETKVGFLWLLVFLVGRASRCKNVGLCPKCFFSSSLKSYSIYAPFEEFSDIGPVAVVAGPIRLLL